MNPLNINSDLFGMVEDATKAPSGHNTQPWKFKLNKDQIIIKPDFSRRLKVVDPDDHALYISLGCALENLILSAKFHGYNPKISTSFYNGKDEIIVDLIKSEHIEKDILYNFIQTRQSTRTAYDDEPIEQAVLDQLKEQTRSEHVEVIYITDKKEIKELEPFIIEGSNLQFNNKEFVDELVSWIRFSKNEVEKKRDGIWHASMGMPRAGRFLGSIIMKDFVSAKSEAKRWKKLIKKSGGFALFIVKENTKENWVKLGQVFQRFSLKATQLNLKLAHTNMPCEEVAVRQKLIKHFNLNDGQQPLLLVRFGYAKVMPYSYRLPIEEVLTSN